MDCTRLLVIDDDPTFGKILAQIGLQSGVEVTVVQQVESLSDLPLGPFDAAIVDFDLGKRNGIELTQHLEDTGAVTESILVSQSQEVATPIGNWPKAIKGFVQKSLGHFAIFEIALAAAEQAAARRAMLSGG